MPSNPRSSSTARRSQSRKTSASAAADKQQADEQAIANNSVKLGELFAKLDAAVTECHGAASAIRLVETKLNDPDVGLYKRLSDSKSQLTILTTAQDDLEKKHEELESSITNMDKTLTRLDTSLLDLVKWKDSASSAAKWVAALIISTAVGVFGKHTWDATSSVAAQGQLQQRQLSTHQYMMNPVVGTAYGASPQNWQQDGGSNPPVVPQSQYVDEQRQQQVQSQQNGAGGVSTAPESRQLPQNQSYQSPQQLPQKTVR